MESGGGQTKKKRAIPKKGQVSGRTKRVGSGEQKERKGVLGRKKGERKVGERKLGNRRKKRLDDKQNGKRGHER